MAKKPLQFAVQKRPGPGVSVAAPEADLAAPGEGQDFADIEFVKIEKNLAEIGFFTPASKRVKSLRSKTITFSRKVDGNRVECKVTFVPGALYGLPSTADQDKWLAFQKFVSDRQRESGQVSNPVTFLSADMLRLLGQTGSGTNFKSSTSGWTGCGAPASFPRAWSTTPAERCG